MGHQIKVRKSGNESHSWVNFIDLKVGDTEISYAPAYFKTHQAAIRAATIRAKQLNDSMNDRED